MRDETKLGVRTSEFWLTGLFATVTGGLGLSISDPTMTLPEAIVKAASLIAVAVMVYGFTKSRGTSKGGAQ